MLRIQEDSAAPEAHEGTDQEPEEGGELCERMRQDVVVEDVLGRIDGDQAQVDHAVEAVHHDAGGHQGEVGHGHGEVGLVLDLVDVLSLTSALEALFCHSCRRKRTSRKCSNCMPDRGIYSTVHSAVLPVVKKQHECHHVTTRDLEFVRTLGQSVDRQLRVTPQQLGEPVGTPERLSLIFWIFGSESSPEYLSDFLPIHIFYNKENGSGSLTVVIVLGALILALLVCGLFEVSKQSSMMSHTRRRRVVSLCRITPNDVASGKVDARIEDAFSHARLSAVCFVFDVVHEITPVEALLLMDHILLLRAKHKVEIYSFVENSALSVGYLLSLVGSKIFATEASVVGKLKFCKTPQPFSMSSKGKNYYEEIALDEKRIGTFSDKMYITKVELFRKNLDLAKVQAAGGMWIGEEAKTGGLVDEISTIHQFMAEKYPRAILVTGGSNIQDKCQCHW
ncbi:unnamed protein product [Sphagnum tenellum]